MGGFFKSNGSDIIVDGASAGGGGLYSTYKVTVDHTVFTGTSSPIGGLLAWAKPANYYIVGAHFKVITPFNDPGGGARVGLGTSGDADGIIVASRDLSATTRSAGEWLENPQLGAYTIPDGGFQDGLVPAQNINFLVDTPGQWPQDVTSGEVDVYIVYIDLESITS